MTDDDDAFRLAYLDLSMSLVRLIDKNAHEQGKNQGSGFLAHFLSKNFPGC